MSLSDLASLSGIPALEIVVQSLFKLYESVEKVKIHKTQCKQLHVRCVKLLLALRHNDESLFGTDHQEAIDRAYAEFERIAKKVDTWSKWGSWKSWMYQGEIKDGLHELNQELAQCAVRLNVYEQIYNSSMMIGIQQTVDAHRAETEQRFQQLLAETRDLRRLVGQPQKEIEGQMLSIQQAIREDMGRPETNQSLQERLFEIKRQTKLLPPITDLTGEVRRISDDPVDISGGFSDVYLGEWLGKEKVALKLTRGINQSPKAQKRFTNEVEIWRQLQHENVAPLYGVATLGGRKYAVSPWMENGDALKYIVNHPSVNRLKLLVEVATGLKFLHKHGIVHGDLRAANILISDDGIACITDFGLSGIIEEEVVNEPSSNATLELLGNSRWMAPELIKPQANGLRAVQRNPATDIWSYGMLCLEILTGQCPFPDRLTGPAVVSDLITGVRPTRPPAEATRRGLSDAVWDLMVKCWQENPSFRPTMSEVVHRMQAYQAAYVDNASAPVKSTSAIPISRPPEAAVVFSESPKSITVTSTSHTPSSTGVTAQRTNGRMVAPVDQSRLTPLSLRPSTAVPNTAHGKSASLDDAPLHGKRVNKSSRPVTAPGAAPQLEIHSENSGSLDDFKMYVESYTIDSTEPPIRFEISPNGERRDQSIPSVIPGEPTLSRPTPEVARSEESGTPSFSSEISPSSSAHIDPPLRKPVYIQYGERGNVIAANLPGLVERLIISKDPGLDKEFRETFLTSYRAFTNADAVFALLLERFDAVSSQMTEQRISVRYSVIAVLDLWLEGHHVELKDVPLLHRMKQLAASMQSPTAAPTLNGLASRLTKSIEKTIRFLVESEPPISPSSSFSSGRSAFRPPDMEPADFAAVLTELESKQFKKILASDCINWLKGIRLSNGVSNFITENNKLSYWVQKRILLPDDHVQRSENLKWFLYATEECRKLRNYSTTFALFAGIASPSITGLKRTAALESVEQKLLQDIEKLTSKDKNFLVYREELGTPENSKAPCIPSLRVHLHDLKFLHGARSTFIEQDGHRDVIDFYLYQEVYDLIRHILSYQNYAPNPPMKPRHLEIQAFIETQLRSLSLDKTFHGWLQGRVEKLTKDELRNYVGFQEELKRARFIR